MIVKKKGTHIIKIPHTLFRDYTANGPLTLILKSSYQFKQLQDWRRFDFNTPGKTQKNLEMIKFISEALCKVGFWKLPQVCISSRVESSMIPILKLIVEKRGGSIARSEHSSTHIIEPPGPDEVDPNDGDEFLRTLEKRDKMNLVHWWYLPDSYDEYLPSNEVEGEEPEEPETPKTWRISQRWLLDTDVYNEWMNEIDYEVPPPETDQPKKGRPKRGRGKKKECGNRNSY